MDWTLFWLVFGPIVGLLGLGATICFGVRALKGRGRPHHDDLVKLHQDRLFYFGQRFRDRLSLETPNKIVILAEAGGRIPVWSGRTACLAAAVPRDAEEDNVEKEWGFERYDARTHSLFSAFQQHLAGNPCWEALEDAEQSFQRYQEACLSAYGTISKEIKNRLPELADQNVRAMAESLLCDASYKVNGLIGLEFSYEPHKAEQDGKELWYLQLGAWGVGHADNLAALQPLTVVHNKLVADLPSTAELGILGEAKRTAHEAIEKVQRDLRPDDGLRRLLLHGRCNLCP